MGVVNCPIELLKVRLQIQNSSSVKLVMPVLFVHINLCSIAASSIVLLKQVKRRVSLGFTEALESRFCENFPVSLDIFSSMKPPKGFFQEFNRNMNQS